MWSLHQPIQLCVVWYGLQFAHAEEPTHIINDAAHEVSTPIAQEPGWDSEDWDVTLIQELGHCFIGLIGGHICHNMLCEIGLEHQDIVNSRQSIQLQGHLYASKVYMQEVLQSSGHNQL